jgi:hypothetical protein
MIDVPDRRRDAVPYAREPNRSAHIWQSSLTFFFCKETFMPDLHDGESIEVKGSARLPYVLKNTGGVYSCTCPAWRNQSVPIERTSKSLLAKRRRKATSKRRPSTSSCRLLAGCCAGWRSFRCVLSGVWRPFDLDRLAHRRWFGLHYTAARPHFGDFLAFGAGSRLRWQHFPVSLHGDNPHEHRAR